MSGAKLQKVIARTERAAFEAGYKVIGSSVLSDGTVHVDLVRRRQSRLTRRIYFVQMEHAQHIKIGIANNSGRRLRALGEWGFSGFPGLFPASSVLPQCLCLQGISSRVVPPAPHPGSPAAFGE